MGRPRQTQAPHNQEITSRGSSRLAEEFQKLPDDLILTIFSKFRDDTKTLIRCSSVCKKWASVVSELDTLSLRFFLSVGGDDSPTCLKHQHHIQKSAIPAFLKVFANLKSLEIKLCKSLEIKLCLSPPSNDDHAFRLKAMLLASDVRSHSTYALVALKYGLLTISNDASFFHETNSGETGERCARFRSYEEFFFFILRNCPKTLTNLVITSSKIQEFGSEGMMFMTKEQLMKFLDFYLESRVNQRWLENTENVVYWLKNPSRNQHSLREQLWIVYQYESTVADDDKPNVVHERISKERDVKELLGGLDGDGDDDD